MSDIYSKPVHTAPTPNSLEKLGKMLEHHGSSLQCETLQSNPTWRVSMASTAVSVSIPDGIISVANDVIECGGVGGQCMTCGTVLCSSPSGIW
jgi:hypothetical protein